MHVRGLVCGLLVGALLSSLAAAQESEEVVQRRKEIEKKYPSIQFNWPKVPVITESSSPAASVTSGEAAAGVEAGLLTKPESALLPVADVEQIAQSEIEQRQKHRGAYTLGPGDVISINVTDHPEFSSYGVRIGFAGELILPLTNEVVYADGLTVDEVRSAIEDKLKAYIERPIVSVFITEFNSKKYYVLGEIGAGIYPIGAASIKLMDALYAAGLPSEGIAAMRRIQIITPHPTHPINRWVNVYAILYKGRMEHNVTIQPGTIIYVPTTIFTKLSRVIRQISVTIEDLSKIPNDLAAFDAGLIAWDQSWNLNIFPHGIDLRGGNKASQWN